MEVSIVGAPTEFRDLFIRSVDRIVVRTVEHLVLTYAQRCIPEVFAVTHREVLRQNGFIAFVKFA